MKIVIGGQIDKKEIAADVAALLPTAEVRIKGDLDAVMALKQGQAQYYIGACNTGGGGALAMALALLGKDRCATLSMPGHIKSEEEIQEAVERGCVAFGFTAQHREQILPILLPALEKQS